KRGLVALLIRGVEPPEGLLLLAQVGIVSAEFISGQVGHSPQPSSESHPRTSVFSAFCWAGVWEKEVQTSKAASEAKSPNRVIRASLAAGHGLCNALVIAQHSY